MTAIDFPNSPTLNEVFTSGSRSWKWNGTVWQTVTTSTGSQGDKGGLRYAFSTSTTMAEPDPGFIGFNNATVASVTAIAINAETIEGTDVSNYIYSLSTSLPDELSVIKYYLIVQGNVNNDATYAIFAITGVVDNTTWLQLTAEYVSGTMPSESEELVISLSRVGDLGPTGPETSLTIGTVETSLPGATGAVSITGPAGDQVLSFTLPMGPTGPETSISVDTTTGLPGSNAEVSVTGPAGDQLVSFVIPQGPTGPETSITIGTVDTNLPGSTAAASITGPAGSQVLSLTIPQGPTGPETSISVSTTTTGPGETASVSVSGPAGNQTVAFVIPQGPTGPETSIDIGTIDTGLPGSTAAASVTGPPGSQLLSLTIPQGPTGPETSITIGTVETSLPGATGAVSISGPAGDQVLSFTLAMGPTGPETSISLGTVDTSLPGGTGAASITGPAGDQVLSLTIPQGPTGPGGVYQYSVTGPTAPTTINGEAVANGDAWFNSETGRFYIYYDGFWVENTSNLVGPTGPAGIVWTGAWDGSTGATYDINDVAVYTNGNAYICTLPVTAGNSTLYNPVEGSHWDLFLEAGTDGTNGNTGPSGDPTLTVQTAKTANYTVAVGDISQLIQMNSASPLTLSIPTDATYNFPIGTQINVVQIGAGQVTVAAVTPGTTTVNATPGLKLRAQWSGATLIKRAANTWWVTGDLVL